jgi:hypothetical protein
MNGMRTVKLLLIPVFILCSGLINPSVAQVKITDGADLSIDDNSLLEMESSSRGLLIPRMAINNVNQPAPLTAPVPVGMLVYSTGGTVTDGFYYWTGTLWQRFVHATVQVTEGGTGLTTGVSGGIPAFTGTTTITSSGVLTQNALVIGGGAGAAPSALIMGTANQVLAVNSGGTGYTHRTIKHQIGPWGRNNLTRNQTDLQLIMVIDAGTNMSASGSRMIMAFDGRIKGIAVSGSAACTAGTAIFRVFRNNAATAVSTTISTANPQYVYLNTGTETFVTGDILDIRVSTDGTFSPNNSIDYISWIIIEWTN